MLMNHNSDLVDHICLDCTSGTVVRLKLKSVFLLSVLLRKSKVYAGKLKKWLFSIDWSSLFFHICILLMPVVLLKQTYTCSIVLLKNYSIMKTSSSQNSLWWNETPDLSSSNYCIEKGRHTQYGVLHSFIRDMEASLHVTCCKEIPYTVCLCIINWKIKSFVLSL